MDKNKLITRLRGQFEKFIEKRSTMENAESILLRRKLFDAFEVVGFPVQKEEEWKYWNINQFLDDEMYLFTDPEGIIAPKDKISDVVESLGENILVFTNGFFNKELSKICSECIKIEVEHHIDPMEQSDTGFSLLRKAFSVETIKITIGNTLVEPMTILFSTNSTGLPLMVQSQVKIITPSETEGTVIERYIHFGEETCLSNADIKCELDMFSKLKHYRMQNLSKNEAHVHNLKVEQKEGSHYKAVTVTDGKGYVRNTHEVLLTGERAYAELYGTYALEEEAFADNHTAILHEASHTQSKQIYKGTLDEKSHGVFNGKVVVKKNLFDINSDQSNKTMLLSEGARMDTKPELQIFSDDVKCSHGAALGHLDEEALFFMRARGIGEQKAKYMMSIGFIQDILAQIDDEDLRQKVQYLMKKKYLLE